MVDRRGYRVEKLSGNRRMVAAVSAISREYDAIHLMTEVDITEPRGFISEYRQRTGERLSLTGYIVACLARTFEEFPRFNSFRKGGRLVILDDLTIGVLFEREFEGESIPEGMGIKEANHKTFRQINDELREVQQHTGKHLGSASGIPWIRFIPDFLLKTFVRLAARNIAMKKRFGVTAVTAVGMFGSGPLWPVPLTSGTVTVAVGSIAKRPVPRSGQLEEREHLCLTISFNHDLIDGAPAARFVSRFAEWLSSGREIEEVIAHEKAESADKITDTQKRKEEE